MGLVCVGSVRAAPGATTLAVLMGGAWPTPRRVVVVEADPDGGVIASRFGIGRDPGLAALAAALRGGPAPAEVVWDCAQRLPGGLAVVPAHESAEVVTATLRDLGPRLVRWCSAVEELDVIVDCGRLRPDSPAGPLLDAAKVVLVTVRPRPDELYPAVHCLRALGGSPRVAGLVLVGDRPYGREEVSAQLGLPVVGVVADDRRGAEVLWDGGSGRALRTSPLARTARALTDEVAGTLGVEAAPAPAAPDRWPWRRRAGRAEDADPQMEDPEAYVRMLEGRPR